MIKKISALLAIVFFVGVGTVMATSLSDVVNGIDITKYDGETGTSSNTNYDAWWNRTEEDQEVEAGMQTGQKWDLEAMYWDSSNSELYIIGGFDFKDGVEGWDAGDVFLFGSTYDYVLDFDRTGDVYSHLNINDSNQGSFNLYRASHGELETIAPYFQQNNTPSDPYAHDDNPESKTGYQRQTIDASGTNNDSNLGSGSLTFYEGLDDGLGLTGGSHYVLGIDLPLLDPDTYEVHMTMECGNDDMEGNLPVPEPTTILLLGLGLLGLGLGSKKRMFVKMK